jgi:hypothetical protein
MVFSYNMVRPRRTVTLPSVESWGTNMNIVKDPPKSLFTRRINKVGSDNKLLNMRDESGDRISEIIKIYPRGVNPMVRVNYNNMGITNGRNATLNNQVQASLPYKAFNNGAFRPPALEGLTSMLPLSRMNRLPTYAFANKQNLNAVLETVACHPHKKKIIRPHVLKSRVRPTATYNLDKPIVDKYSVNYVITNPLKVQANTLRNVKNNNTARTWDTRSHIRENYSPTIVYSNVRAERPVTRDIQNTDSFISETLKGSMHSAKNMTSENFTLNRELPNAEKNIPVYSCKTTKGVTGKTIDLINSNKVLDKEVLYATANVNKAQVQGTQFLSRDAYLHPKIDVQGYHQLGNHIPSAYHDNQMVKLDSKKIKVLHGQI